MAHLVIEARPSEGESEEEAQALLEKGGDPLLTLCRKYADAFDAKMRASDDPVLSQGLAKWEAEACEKFLYQLARGHVRLED